MKDKNSASSWIWYLFFVLLVLVIGFFVYKGITGNAVAEQPLKIYVSLDGKNSNPGTFESPKKDLNAVHKMIYDSSQKGEYYNKNVEVIFRGGTYIFSERQNWAWIPPLRNPKQVTIKPYNNEQVIFDGQKNNPLKRIANAVYIGGESIKFTGFTIRNYYAWGIMVGNSRNVVIENNIFEGIGNSGIDAANLVPTQRDITLNKGAFPSEHCEGKLSGYAAIGTRSDNNTKIIHNTFKDIENFKIKGICDALVHGIYTGNSLNIVIDQNIFYSSKTNVIKITESSHNAKVRNNVFQDTGLGHGEVVSIYDQSSTFTAPSNNAEIANNIWWRPYPYSTTGGEIGIQPKGKGGTYTSSNNIQRNACPSDKPFAVITQLGANYVRGCCSSQTNCIDANDGTCYADNSLKNSQWACYMREFSLCNSNNLNEVSGKYTCASSGWVLTSSIRTPTCKESDWTSSLNPTTCPSTSKQTKTWKKSGTCTGGVSHPATEIISCTYSSPTPACPSDKPFNVISTIIGGGSFSGCCSLPTKCIDNYNDCFEDNSKKDSMWACYDQKWSACIPENLNSVSGKFTCKSSGWVETSTVVTPTSLTCPSTDKPFEVTSKIWGNTYLNGCCPSSTNCIDDVNVCFSDDSKKNSEWACYNHEWSQCNSTFAGAVAGKYSCNGTTWVIPKICTDSDWTSSLNPTTCPSTNQQIKNWTKIGACTGGISHPATEIVSCNYLPLCISANWNYVDGECNISGKAERHWVKNLECYGGEAHTAIEILNCNYVAPVCDSFDFSNWSDCVDGLQTRVVLNSYPENCQGGSLLLSETCEEHLQISSSGNKVIFKKGNKKVFALENNQSLNLIMLSEKNRTNEGFYNDSAFVILSLGGEYNKSVYIDLNSDSEGVCVNDNEISDIVELVNNCTFVYCPGSLGNISCERVENNSFVINGLKHSGVIEVRKEFVCGDGFCSNDEDCSSCVSDCGGSCPVYTPSSSSGGGGGSNRNIVVNNTSQSPVVINNSGIKNDSSKIDEKVSEIIEEFKWESGNRQKIILFSIVGIFLVVLIILFFIYFRIKRQENEVSTQQFDKVEI